MWRLDELLARNRTPHRTAAFAGGHEWLPEGHGHGGARLVRPACRRERSGRRGHRAVSRRGPRAGGERLEAAGRTGEALRVWQGLAEDLAGGRRRRTRAEQVDRLGAPAPPRPGARAQAGRPGPRLDRRRQRRRSWSSSRDPLPALPRLLREFEVEALRKQASSADPVLARSATRRLNAVAASAGYYVPEHLKAQGQLADAARWYELAAAIDPADPGPQLGLARVYARAGNRKAALDALRTAVAREACACRGSAWPRTRSWPPSPATRRSRRS